MRLVAMDVSGPVRPREGDVWIDESNFVWEFRDGRARKSNIAFPVVTEPPPAPNCRCVVLCLYCTREECRCTRNMVLQISAIAVVVVGACIAIWALVLHVG